MRSVSAIELRKGDGHKANKPTSRPYYLTKELGYHCKDTDVVVSLPMIMHEEPR